jgi:hypothetical protein
MTVQQPPTGCKADDPRAVSVMELPYRPERHAEHISAGFLVLVIKYRGTHYRGAYVRPTLSGKGLPFFWNQLCVWELT